MPRKIRDILDGDPVAGEVGDTGRQPFIPGQLKPGWASVYARMKTDAFRFAPVVVQRVLRNSCVPIRFLPCERCFRDVLLVFGGGRRSSRSHASSGMGQRDKKLRGAYGTELCYNLAFPDSVFLLAPAAYLLLPTEDVDETSPIVI